MTGIGNVNAAIIPAKHPNPCPVCKGSVRVRVARIRRRGSDSVPSWPGAPEEACPSGLDSVGLAAWLGLSGSAPVGPEGGAA